MAQVTVTIAKHVYRVACGEGEEHLGRVCLLGRKLHAVFSQEYSHGHERNAFVAVYEGMVFS